MLLRRHPKAEESQIEVVGRSRRIGSKRQEVGIGARTTHNVVEPDLMSTGTLLDTERSMTDSDVAVIGRSRAHLNRDLGDPIEAGKPCPSTLPLIPNHETVHGRSTDQLTHDSQTSDTHTASRNHALDIVSAHRGGILVPNPDDDSVVGRIDIPARVDIGGQCNDLLVVTVNTDNRTGSRQPALHREDERAVTSTSPRQATREIETVCTDSSFTDHRHGLRREGLSANRQTDGLEGTRVEVHDIESIHRTTRSNERVVSRTGRRVLGPVDDLEASDSRTRRKTVGTTEFDGSTLRSKVRTDLSHVEVVRRAARLNRQNDGVTTTSHGQSLGLLVVSADDLIELLGNRARTVAAPHLNLGSCDSGRNEEGRPRNVDRPPLVVVAIGRVKGARIREVPGCVEVMSDPDTTIRGTRLTREDLGGLLERDLVDRHLSSRRLGSRRRRRVDVGNHLHGVSRGSNPDRHLELSRGGARGNQLQTSVVVPIDDHLEAFGRVAVELAPRNDVSHRAPKVGIGRMTDLLFSSGRDLALSNARDIRDRHGRRRSSTSATASSTGGLRVDGDRGCCLSLIALAVHDLELELNVLTRRDIGRREHDRDRIPIHRTTDTHHRSRPRQLRHLERTRNEVVVLVGHRTRSRHLSSDGRRIWSERDGTEDGRRTLSGSTTTATGVRGSAAAPTTAAARAACRRKTHGGHQQGGPGEPQNVLEGH